MIPQLKSYSIQKPPLQVSKWLDLPVLLDADEMASLFQQLQPFYIFLTSAVVKKGEGFISSEHFLKKYSEYIEEIKNGKIINEDLFRTIFSAIFTTSTECLYSLTLADDKELLRIEKPVVQLQPHRIHFSKEDFKFRSMNFGMDTISWGIQFSYPQLFQDQQKNVHKTKDSEEFPNTKLFQGIQQWVRYHTVPTPFIVNGNRVNVPMRLGKHCFSWINHHPHLQTLGLSVKNEN